MEKLEEMSEVDKRVEYRDRSADYISLLTAFGSAVTASSALGLCIHPAAAAPLGAMFCSGLGAMLIGIAGAYRHRTREKKRQEEDRRAIFSKLEESLSNFGSEVDRNEIKKSYRRNDGSLEEDKLAREIMEEAGLHERGE
jgi:hypothetical protein